MFVSEPSPARRELAAKVGVPVVLDPAACDVRREVYLKTGKVGADVVLECTGSPQLLEPCSAAEARRVRCRRWRMYEGLRACVFDA